MGISQGPKAGLILHNVVKEENQSFRKERVHYEDDLKIQSSGP